MSLSYHVYDDVGLFFIRGEGRITQPERVRMALACFNEPAFERCDAALCDFTTAESTPTLADLRELIAIIMEHWRAPGPHTIAIVVDKPITFGRARVFGELVRAVMPFDVKVFYNRERAWEWLQNRSPFSASAAGASRDHVDSGTRHRPYARHARQN
jgi:hypothetical protein